MANISTRWLVRLALDTQRQRRDSHGKEEYVEHVLGCLGYDCLQCLAFALGILCVGLWNASILFSKAPIIDRVRVIEEQS